MGPIPESKIVSALSPENSQLQTETCLLSHHPVGVRQRQQSHGETVFIIALKALRGWPNLPERRLAAALKAFKRQFGFQCLHVSVIAEDDLRELTGNKSNQNERTEQ